MWPHYKFWEILIGNVSAGKVNNKYKNKSKQLYLKSCMLYYRKLVSIYYPNATLLQSCISHLYKITDSLSFTYIANNNNVPQKIWRYITFATTKYVPSRREYPNLSCGNFFNHLFWYLLQDLSFLYIPHKLSIFKKFFKPQSLLCSLLF